MNFKNILSEIEKQDPEVYERLSSRRKVLSRFGSKVAAAALPLAVGSLFQKAYGKTTSTVVDALNFALELEYFEYNYYHMANATGGLIPMADAAGFATLEAQEREHILFLQSVITTMGGVAYTPKYYDSTALNPLYVPDAYDFTAGSIYHVFSSYSQFLMLAATFEDTGVRAYHGQIPSLLSSTQVLKQVFQMATTEARHASFVRLLRRSELNAPEYPGPWINNNIPPAISLQPFYNGEDNAVQSGVTITSLPDKYNPADGTVPQASATAAFDEPLTQASVTSLLSPFMK